MTAKAEIVDPDKGHVWKKNEDGSVDIFVVDENYHNGPGCVNCGYDYCHHCQPGPSRWCEGPPTRLERVAFAVGAFFQAGVGAIGDQWLKVLRFLRKYRAGTEPKP